MGMWNLCYGVVREIFVIGVYRGRGIFVVSCLVGFVGLVGVHKGSFLRRLNRDCSTLGSRPIKACGLGNPTLQRQP